MNTKSFLRKIKNANPDSSRYSVVEKKYAISLPDEARAICSLNPSPFWNGRDVCRVLTLSEIVNAESELHVAFDTLGLIPFFDCGDNNFIVLNVRTHQWGMFNIVDGILWRQDVPLGKLLPRS